MSDPNLVTTFNFHGREYLIKMNITNNCLELVVTDKLSAEEWQCSYDVAYIENITHKTGNFKQFDIFTTMLKSGLLKTSECITLDLLTFEDLESLRTRRVKSHSTTRSMGTASHNHNRRYLIVTYTVEFDRIHYPLPLEYCGPPDPSILQANIRRLETELVKTREQLNSKASNKNDSRVYVLQKRIDELTFENSQLHEEMKHLHQMANKTPKNQVYTLERAIANLERSFLSERRSHHYLIQKLQTEKVHLTQELQRIQSSEKSLQVKLHKALSQSSRNAKSDYNAQKKNEQNGQIMFKIRNSPRSQRMTNRSRSISPRLNKNDNAEMNIDVKSRGSSHSRNSDLEFQSKNRVSPKLSRKPSTIHFGQRSRSSSPASNISSTASDQRSKGSATSVKCTKARRNEMDFKILEGRIQALQKILKNGIRLH